MGNVQYYSNLSIVMAVLCVVLLAMAIFMWFRFDIRRNMAVITGSEARKNIERIRKEAESGSVQSASRRKNAHARISWNTSGNLDAGVDLEKTTLLEPDAEATTLLDTSSDFVIEREEGTPKNAK